MDLMRFYIMLLTALLLGNGTLAQVGFDTVEHAVKKRIRFSDDFSSDIPGHFPSRWVADSGHEESFSVVRDQGANALRSIEGDSCYMIRPRVDMQGLRSDSLGMAFDIYFEKPDSKIAVTFWSKPGKMWDVHFVVTNKGEEGLGLHYYSFAQRYLPTTDKNIPAAGTGRWHRIRINFYNGALTFLVDNRVEAFYASTGYYPADLLLHFCTATRLRNFSLNAVQGDYDFSGIVSRSGFLTHALRFDVNESKIKEEGIAFLVRLGGFLLRHPEVRLEISGHTDSDGDADANTRLSQARAEAIKAYLVREGVDAGRLQAKGYGAARPLQSNISAEDKANNRRVEFKKL